MKKGEKISRNEKDENKVPLKVLILEDSILDVELIRIKLKSEFEFTDRVVYDKVEYAKEIVKFIPDIILSDYSMPQFTGLEALTILQESSFNCPFIIITGAIDEETAVACIKAGADDYLLKDRLVRLPAAIRQSILQHNISKEKEETRKELEVSHILLRDLFKRLELVRDEEKKRISMEIHDQLGQELTANKLGLFYLKQQLSNEGNIEERINSIREKIEDLIGLSGNTIKTVRKIAHQLRPVILEDLGLLPAIESMIKGINENGDINWKIQNEIHDQQLQKDFIPIAYRIVQETVTNIIRHANANECSIHFKRGKNKLRIKIKDNGIGFDPKEQKTNGKLGLFGIEERISPWQGKMKIESKINIGTEIVISFPLSIICN